MKHNNFYITTPIYYPSGDSLTWAMHIQVLLLMFLLDLCVMIIVKFFSLTGTDEHGLKIQKAAEKKGLDPLSLL